MLRVTTSATLKNYRYNLNRSRYNQNQAQNTVLTGRNFNSYKEDPAAAARSFQLRSTLSHTSSQLVTSDSIVSKYEVAYSALGTVVDDVNKAKYSLTRAANDPTGSGRAALGQELEQIAQGIIEHMNVTYGANHVFAGADELNVPFVLAENGTLTYRGIDVTTGDAATLEYLAEGESKYLDLGLGLKEEQGADGQPNGELIQTSAFDSALSGIYYLGYGVDQPDGDSKNIVSIIKELGDILQRCDESGSFESAEDEADFSRLFDKFEAAASELTDKYTSLSARANFLKSNQKLLENRNYTLQEQISNLEDVDEADAITAYSWAQYCYNAALKVGNSILSQSLMDYMNT